MDTLPLYFSEHIIKHFEIDAAGHFSITALANHIQENAAEHAQRLNVGYTQMTATNHAWMLARVRFKIYNTPKLGQKIETETWVKDYDRMFSYRDFHFKHNGEIFGIANTAWFVVNIENKRIVPPEKFAKDAYKFKNRCIILDSIPKLKGVEGQAEHVFMHQVKYSSIDLNHHVNNVAYLQWYLDFLPDSLALNPVDEMIINYLHEIKLNDKINIYYNVQRKKEGIHVTCEMVNAATDQTSCRIEAMHKELA